MKEKDLKDIAVTTDEDDVIQSIKIVDATEHSNTVPPDFVLIPPIDGTLVHTIYGNSVPINKEFETGAVRSTDCDNYAYTLLSPIGLRRVAATCKEGELKYSAYNWEKGMPVREMLEHGLQHIFQYLDGDRKEDHLAHAAWNLLAAMHSEESWPELNKDTLREPKI